MAVHVLEVSQRGADGLRSYPLLIDLCEGLADLRETMLKFAAPLGQLAELLREECPPRFLLKVRPAGEYSVRLRPNLVKRPLEAASLPLQRRLPAGHPLVSLADEEL